MKLNQISLCLDLECNEVFTTILQHSFPPAIGNTVRETCPACGGREHATLSRFLDRRPFDDARHSPKPVDHEMVVLGIEHDRLMVSYSLGSLRSRVTRYIHPIEGLESLNRFLTNRAGELGCTVDELKISRSYTLDHPEEYTQNPELIQLCKSLQERFNA